MRFLSCGRVRLAALVALTVAGLVSLMGASVASANGVPLATGDVLAGVGNGIIKHFDANGTLLDSINNSTGSTFNTGMCFDSAGNLYATDFNSGMSKFDGGANLLAASFGSGFNADPESCVVDASNNVYVGQADGSGNVLKFDTSGNPLASYAPATESRGTDWIDLASNQCTLHYTSEGTSIKTFNVCTNTQLPDFATGLPGPCYAHRILSDGSELVACSTVVEHVDSTGNVIKTYSPGGTGNLFALNLDPDGTSFWTGDLSSGDIWRIDTASGAVLKTFNAGINTALAGLTIVGEITAAKSEITLAPLTATNPVGTTHTVTATATTGGVPQKGATVTFTVTGANPQTGTGVTDANGQATFTYTGNNAGTDTIVASFVDKTGKTQTSNSVTKTWTGDQAISATGKAVSATEGAGFSGTVATFSDPDLAATASEYSATINWGDGSSTSSGTISGSNGNFSVNGTHTYAEEGTYSVTATITDVDNPSNSATATSTANVADAALSSKCAAAATSPQAFAGQTATFTDADPAGATSDYTATINWGDSSSSAGTVSAGTGSGPYTVTGSHTYGSTGPFTITTTIKDAGGSQTVATCTTLIFGTAKGGNFVIGDNNAANGTLVTFWGAQWWKLNSLSGGSGPASFKGFEDSPATARCGTSWTTDPGNSTPPPAGPLPAYMLVIVSSKVSQSGSSISGNTVHEVVVKTNAGYAPDPGHAGTGTVVAQIC